MSEREHSLKTWPAPFAQVWLGNKTAEFRRTDRAFRVGDRLILNEWEPTTEGYTGRRVIATITHRADHDDGFGIPDGYAMLSFRVECHEEG